MKALGQAVVLDRQNEHFKMQVERFTFTNLLTWTATSGTGWSTGALINLIRKCS